MEIKNCLMSDANEILSLYEAARNLQTQRKMVIWPSFEKSFIEKARSGKKTMEDSYWRHGGLQLGNYL